MWFLTHGSTFSYFSCFADVTEHIISQGNTTYELSNLDISETLINNPGYCNNRTNFAGWSIYVVFEDSTLPLNQLSIFQGLEIIDRNVQEKIIVLDNLNVIDNQNAKIGFRSNGLLFNPFNEIYCRCSIFNLGYSISFYIFYFFTN